MEETTIENTIDFEKVIQEFEVMTKDAENVQKETLRKILEENGTAEYLLKFGLDGRTDPKSFRNCIPLASHQDLDPYIQRMANGDTSPILTGKPITAISLSSGTTQGKPKFVPFNTELTESTMQIFQTSFAFRNRKFPIENGKAVQFIYSSKQIKIGGLIAGTATTNVYRSSQFKKTMKATQSSCCSPDEVIFGPDFEQSQYCHLLCGLIFSDEVQLVSSTFAHSLVKAFRTFEQIWEDLCSNIREGVLADRITDPLVRDSVSKILEANPTLADAIHERCSRLSNCNWYGLIPTLFPNIKYIYGIMTGSMEPYLKKLRHYAGEVPLVSADYGSSEGWVGANVNPDLPPESATFAVLPNIGFFEFIPLAKSQQHDDTEPEPVGLTEVKVEEEYEVITTTFAGLYRYRLGDVVKVKGFHNATPELQFVRRSNLMLNINIDKTTEKDLQLSIEAAAAVLGGENLEVVDFTSQVNSSNDPANYVIYWEISGDASEVVLQECCNCLDRSFVDPGYTGSRKIKTIGSLELRVLKRGTFHKIMDHFVKQGAAVSQFKTPRCVGASNVAVLEILGKNVAKTYSSSAYD